MNREGGIQFSLATLFLLAALICFIIAGIVAIGEADVSYRALIAFGLACLAAAGIVP